MRRTGFGVGSVLALVLVGSGCQTFRADVGMGLGIGASIKIPAVLHTGFSVGNYMHMGWNYNEGFHFGHNQGLWDLDVSMIYHFAEMRDSFAVTEVGDYVHWRYVPWSHHECATVAPVIFEPNHAMSYGLELEAQFIFFDLRLGWNPWFLSHELAYDPAAYPSGDSEYDY